MLAKVLATAVGIGLMAAPSAKAEGRDPTPVPTETLDKVKAALPEGWKASASGDTLTVRREKPVEIYNAVNLPAAPDDAKGREELKARARSEPYEIKLRFTPRIGPDERRLLLLKNRETLKALEAQRDGLRDIPHKFNEYLPSTPDQKQRVAAYEKARKSLVFQDLPGYYTDRYSIYASDSVSPFEGFLDEKVGRECRAVLGKLQGLFTAYEPDGA